MSDRKSSQEIASLLTTESLRSDYRIHGFEGGVIRRGHILRVLMRSGRKFYDSLLFESDSESMSGFGVPPAGEALVLSRTTFDIPSELGPVLVSDRTIPFPQEDPDGWVEAITSGLVPDVYVSDHVPVDLENFWELIDLIEPDREDVGLNGFAEALAALGYWKLNAFRDTFWRHLRELDHPGNTVRMGGFVSADASLYYRCEIIARGQESYESHLADPRGGDADSGSWGEALLTIIDDAAIKPLMDASVDIETGHNAEHWPDAPPPVPLPWESIPSPGPFSSEIQLARLRLTSEPRTARRRLVSFVGYATSANGTVRELMGCLMADSFVWARKEVVAFLTDRLQEGEALHPRLYVYSSAIGGVTRGSAVVELVRRSSLSIDEYIATYYTGELAPPKAKRRAVPDPGFA